MTTSSIGQRTNQRKIDRTNGSAERSENFYRAELSTNYWM